MSNPYASPTSDSAEQPKKRRFGLPLLFVFLLMLGGCGLSLLFVSGVSVTNTTSPPVTIPAQPAVSEIPTELTAEEPAP